ncbi:MAG: cytochrome c oxidase subunit II [Deltaproteobacteria bacterium]|nr:cytochrome c oxidase subunit II [Deltaproteobacteria bacterium]
MNGLGPMLGEIDRGFWMPDQASDFAVHVDALFNFILWLSIFFFVLLMWLTARFAWKYRASSTNTRSSPLAHNFKLEFLWSAIPTVLLVVIFAWGFNDFTALSATPADAVQLRVVGQKWNWSVSYPKLDRECTSEFGANGEANVDFYIPVNQPFTVQMSSEDVLHSFWIPAFRVKRDALPNRYTGYTVTPTRTGIFDVYCAEYCGDNHSQMRGKVHVLSQEEWEEWKKGDKCKLDPKAPDYKPKLFSKLGCASCHGVKQEQGVIVGPNLHGLVAKGNEDTSAGSVPVDDAYLRESIEYPEKKIVTGFAGKNMPSFRGRISEDELAALIDYIKSLK